MGPRARLLLAAALLGFAGLAVSQTKTTASWSAAVGGSKADKALGMCINGKDRFIAGTVTGEATSSTKDYYEFVWSDNMKMKQVASNALFVGKVTGEDSLTWVKQPKMCVQDQGGQRVCAAEDDPYVLGLDTGIKDMGCGSKGRPVILVREGNNYIFQQTWWNWQFIVRGINGRIRCPIQDTGCSGRVSQPFVGDAIMPTGGKGAAIGGSAAFDPSAGTYKSETSDLKLLRTHTTSSRFYALFSYKGDVRFSKQIQGKVSAVKTLQADGTYIQVIKGGVHNDANLDRYDMADGLYANNGREDRVATGPATPVQQYVNQYGVGGTQETYVDTAVRRDGFFLMALDINTGDLLYVQPIWSQMQTDPGSPAGLQKHSGPAFTAFTLIDPPTKDDKDGGFTVSDFDQAVYFYGTLNHRVVFSTPVDFTNNNGNSVINTWLPEAGRIEPNKDPKKTNARANLCAWQVPTYASNGKGAILNDLTAFDRRVESSACNDYVYNIIGSPSWIGGWFPTTTSGTGTSAGSPPIPSVNGFAGGTSQPSYFTGDRNAVLHNPPTSSWKSGQTLIKRGDFDSTEEVTTYNTKITYNTITDPSFIMVRLNPEGTPSQTMLRVPKTRDLTVGIANANAIATTPTYQFYLPKSYTQTIGTWGVDPKATTQSHGFVADSASTKVFIMGTHDVGAGYNGALYTGTPPNSLAAYGNKAGASPAGVMVKAAKYLGSAGYTSCFEVSAGNVGAYPTGFVTPIGWCNEDSLKGTTLVPGSTGVTPNYGNLGPVDLNKIFLGAEVPNSKYTRIADSKSNQRLLSTDSSSSVSGFVYEDFEHYDRNEAFIAGFEGTNLAAGATFVTVLNGMGDVPTVEHLSANGGKVYAIGTHKNTSYISWADAKKAADNPIQPRGSGAEDRWVVRLDSNGGFEDAATMTSSFTGKATINSVKNDAESLFVYGTFTEDLTLDYLDTTRDDYYLIPRVAGTASFFLATFGDAGKSKGSDSSYYNKGMHLGLGLGVGLGFPVIVAVVAVLYLMSKRRAGAGAVSPKAAGEV